MALRAGRLAAALGHGRPALPRPPFGAAAAWGGCARRGGAAELGAAWRPADAEGNGVGSGYGGYGGNNYGFYV